MLLGLCRHTVLPLETSERRAESMRRRRVGSGLVQRVGTADGGGPLQKLRQLTTRGTLEFRDGRQDPSCALFDENRDDTRGAERSLLPSIGPIRDRQGRDGAQGTPNTTVFNWLVIENCAAPRRDRQVLADQVLQLAGNTS